MVIPSLAGARRRLAQWRERSVNRRIFAAMMITGVLGLLVRGVAMIKDLVVAHAFGTGDSVDAFLIALSLPMFAINVLAGPAAAALVPAYVQAHERSVDQARRLLQNATLCVLVILGATSVLMALSIDHLLPLFASGFSPAKLSLTRRLFFILLPVLLIEGVSTAWAAVLNARERFALAAIAPMATPLVPLVLLVTLPRLGIYALAAGTAIGFAVEASLTAVGLRAIGLPWRPRWSGMEPAFRSLAGQYVSMVIGTFFIFGTTLVDQSMAAALAPGSVAALSYGNKVVTLCLSLATMALGSAVLPYFSQLVARRDWQGMRASIVTFSRLVVLVGVPTTVVLVAASEPLVSLLFRRGTFSAEDVRAVARVQSMFALQIPFYLLGSLALRLIFALRGNRMLIAIYMFGLAAHVGLNVLLIRLLGVAGIALSYTLAHVINLVLYLFAIRWLWSRHADAVLPGANAATAREAAP